MKHKNSTTLFFIRHGETPSNANHVNQGNRINEYLDTRGILQVEKLASIVRHLGLSILYTSYLHRAEESAVIIDKELPSPVNIIHDYRLRERDFGTLTGKPDQEIEALLPTFKELELIQMYDYRPYGGESVDDVRQRIFGAIMDIVENNENKNVGIITHAGVIRLLLFHFPEAARIYYGGQNTELKISNTDIYEWEVTLGIQANIKALLT